MKLIPAKTKVKSINSAAYGSGIYLKSENFLSNFSLAIPDTV